MTDSYNKHPNKHQNANSEKRRDVNRTTAAQLVRRLPLLRQLDVSAQLLIELNPIWQRWLSANLPDISAPAEPQPGEVSGCRLHSFKEQKLSISCDNSAIASLIRHRQESLRGQLDQHLQNLAADPTKPNLTSAPRISAIRIIMALDQPSKSQSVVTTDSAVQNRRTTVHREKVDAQAIKSIEQCQKSVSDAQLAESLARLANTLKDS